MNVVEDAIDRLYAALSTVPGLHIAKGVGVRLDPPAAVVAPPRLIWNGVGSEPAEATFTVPVVVRDDEQAMVDLMRWVPLVVAALATVDNAAVGDVAEPGLWGKTQQPAYLIKVDMGLINT